MDVDPANLDVRVADAGDAAAIASLRARWNQETSTDPASRNAWRTGSRRKGTGGRRRGPADDVAGLAGRRAGRHGVAARVPPYAAAWTHRFALGLRRQHVRARRAPRRRH